MSPSGDKEYPNTFFLESDIYQLLVHVHHICVVTNKFPDGNFSLPRLAIYAFASQNKNITAPSTKVQNPAQAGFFIFCGAS